MKQTEVTQSDHLQVFSLLQRTLTNRSYMDEFTQYDVEHEGGGEFTDEYEEVAAVAAESYRELIAADVEEWLRIDGGR